MSPTIAADASCTAVRPFRFLDLPAELRNRVYEYALYESFARSAGNKEVIKHLIYTLSTAKVHDAWFHTQHGRPYIGLTQVNRQIRTEFSPQRYHGSYKPALPFDTQHEHLSTFPFRAEHLPPQYIVALEKLRDAANESASRVDILPLLDVHVKGLSPFVTTMPFSPLLRMALTFCCFAGSFQSQGLLGSMSGISIVRVLETVGVTLRLRREATCKLLELTTFLRSAMEDQSWSELEIGTQSNTVSFWCDPFYDDDGAYDDDYAYDDDGDGTEEFW